MDQDPGAPKTCGSGSGSPTLLLNNFIFEKLCMGLFGVQALTWRVEGERKNVIFFYNFHSSWLANYFVTIITVRRCSLRLSESR
jgi:hypothetical protein